MNLSEVKHYGNLELLAKQLVEGFVTGLHKSPYHGFSVEFAEHRLYNSGESTRHVDWKVYGRTDKLYTKQYEEETNLRSMILLDNSSSMYYPVDSRAKIRFSILAAAAITHMLYKQRDASGLCVFSDAIEQISQVKSTSAHVHQLFTNLQELFDQPHQSKKTKVAEVIHQVAERIHKRSLVIIFSDMMDGSENQDELFAALQHLKHNKHEVLLFHVYDKKTELDFNFSEKPIVFVDVESGQEEKVQPSQVKEHYQRIIKKKFDDIKIKCGQYKIDFIEVDCNQSIDKILMPYLAKRSKMR